MDDLVRFSTLSKSPIERNPLIYNYSGCCGTRYCYKRVSPYLFPVDNMDGHQQPIESSLSQDSFFPWFCNNGKLGIFSSLNLPNFIQVD